MAVSWTCPECDNVVSVDREKCMCGHPRPANANPSNPQGAYGSCCITGCPMPGALSPGFKSRNWYCRWHYRYRNDPQHCQRITEDLKANPPVISGCTPSGKFINNPPVTERVKK
jgi:hypothetical protein